MRLADDPGRQARLEADARARWERMRATIAAGEHPPDDVLSSMVRHWWGLMPPEVAEYVAARLTGKVRRPRGNPGRSRHAFMRYKRPLSSGGGKPKDGEPTPQGKLLLGFARMQYHDDAAGAADYVERMLARDYMQVLPYIQQLRKKLGGGVKHPKWHPPEIQEALGEEPARDAATLTLQIVARRHRLVTVEALRKILKRQRPYLKILRKGAAK